jgi:hypothetical protein
VVRAADILAGQGRRERACRLIRYLLQTGNALLGREPLEKRLRAWK